MTEEQIKKICKAMVEKAYARLHTEWFEPYDYQTAVREFCNAFGMDDAEIMYIEMNASTCSLECLDRIANQPVIERI